MVPTAFAAQGSDYHDLCGALENQQTTALWNWTSTPASHETFYCAECGKMTGFTAWRTPEYTRDGNTALSRNVLYSDGTMIGGEGKGLRP